jgi:hypothetical protein
MAAAQEETPLVGRTVRRSGKPTVRQVAAVYEVMRLLRRDKTDHCSDSDFLCDSCGRSRPRDGSVTYGESVFCNGCATDYELLRLAGIGPR